MRADPVVQQPQNGAPPAGGAHGGGELGQSCEDTARTSRCQACIFLKYFYLEYTNEGFLTIFSLMFLVILITLCMIIYGVSLLLQQSDSSIIFTLASNLGILVLI